MIKEKRLNLPDINIEAAIAKRLGWSARPLGDGSYCLVDADGKRRSDNYVEAGCVWRYVPPYLTDRNAAAEIVAWFAKHSLQGIKEFEQMVQCEQIPEVASVLANNYPVFCGLLATPRQIVLAACKVWGLEASNGND